MKNLILIAMIAVGLTCASCTPNTTKTEDSVTTTDSIVNDSFVTDTIVSDSL